MGSRGQRKWPWMQEEAQGAQHPDREQGGGQQLVRAREARRSGGRRISEFRVRAGVALTAVLDGVLAVPSGSRGGGG